MAILGNFSPMELALVAGLAVIVFGKRLPEVAARAYGQFRRMRASLDDLRRETGIDRELREIEYTVRDAARKANIANPLAPAAEDDPERRDPDSAPLAEPDAEAVGDVREGDEAAREGNVPGVAGGKRRPSPPAQAPPESYGGQADDR